MAQTFWKFHCETTLRPRSQSCQLLPPAHSPPELNGGFKLKLAHRPPVQKPTQSGGDVG